ncbi:12531_t:CDS:2, partial [Acaulospora colombiana]
TRVSHEATRQFTAILTNYSELKKFGARRCFADVDHVLLESPSSGTSRRYSTDILGKLSSLVRLKGDVTMKQFSSIAPVLYQLPKLNH